MGHMGANQGSIEFRDLGYQFLEVTVFLYPSLDVLQHLQRDIRGLGLSLASRPPAMFGDLDQRPGQERADSGQFLDPGVSHSTNERRMLRHFHGG